MALGITKQRKRKTAVYWCETCDCYHLTTVKKKTLKAKKEKYPFKYKKFN